MSHPKLVAAILSGSLVLSAGAAVAQVGDAGTAGEVVDDSTSQPQGSLGSVPGVGAGDTHKTEEPTEGDTPELVEDGTDEQVTEPGGGTASEPNHGHAVSAVAHATPSGPGKGQVVSAMARSNAVARKAPRQQDGGPATATTPGSPHGKRKG